MRHVRCENTHRFANCLKSDFHIHIKRPIKDTLLSWKFRCSIPGVSKVTNCDDVRMAPNVVLMWFVLSLVLMWLIPKNTHYWHAFPSDMTHIPFILSSVLMWLIPKMSHMRTTFCDLTTSIERTPSPRGGSLFTGTNSLRGVLLLTVLDQGTY